MVTDPPITKKDIALWKQTHQVHEVPSQTKRFLHTMTKLLLIAASIPEALTLLVLCNTYLPLYAFPMIMLIPLSIIVWKDSE